YSALRRGKKIFGGGVFLPRSDTQARGRITAAGGRGWAEPHRPRVRKGPGGLIATITRRRGGPKPWCAGDPQNTRRPPPRGLATAETGGPAHGWAGTPGSMP